MRNLPVSGIVNDGFEDIPSTAVLIVNDGGEEIPSASLKSASI